VDPVPIFAKMLELLSNACTEFASAGILFYFFHKVPPLCILSFQYLICSFIHMLICILSLQAQHSQMTQIPHRTAPHPPIFSVELWMHFCPASKAFSLFAVHWQI
jgi:hypothetical protein